MQGAIAGNSGREYTDDSRDGGGRATHDPKDGEGRAASGTAAEDAKAEDTEVRILLQEQ
jgi:hypothetical protein